MLNISQFKRRLQNSTSAQCLCAVVDTKNDAQFYVISPSGQNNLLCALIEHYQEEIKDAVIDMVTGELIKAPSEEKYQSCGYEFFFLTLTKDLPPIRHHNLPVKLLSHVFSRWQREYQITDAQVFEMLKLNQQYFIKFIDDELIITSLLLNRLHKATCFSKWFLLNVLDKQ